MSATRSFPRLDGCQVEEAALLVLLVGDDWAEAHHDIDSQDETGRRLVRRRLPEGIAGFALPREPIGQHIGQDDGDALVRGCEALARES